MSVSLVDRWTEEILVNYRWLFVVPFLLPISVVYELFTIGRDWLVMRLYSAPRLHERRVKDVQRQIRRWNEEKDGRLMCTGRPAWQTISFRRGLYKSSMYNVRLDLYDILEINAEQMYARVEPMVTMGQLTRALVPLGLSIPVVPELDELTVGGLVMGCGIETSSHRYGLFQRCCLAFELVLSDGSVLRCSEREHSDVFQAVPWSHGSLGFLLAVDLKLVAAPELVRLTYKPLRSLESVAEALVDAAGPQSDNDFVEALLFARDLGVLITGRMVKQDGTKGRAVNRIGRWYKPWYFKHAESVLDSTAADAAYTEYVPLRDYYRRHSRSIFWELQDIIPFGNNPVFRFLLGWTTPPRVSLLKLTQTQAVKRLYETKHVIQDLLLPIDKLKDAISLLDKSLEVYPLWLCPFKLGPEPGFVHTPNSKEELYVDIGVYGAPKAADYEATRAIRSIEKFIIDNAGFQMLYADTYTTREEFRKMFDHELYDRVRKELKCEHAFPEVYDKVKKSART